MTRSTRAVVVLAAVAGAGASLSSAFGAFGYGVNAAGTLFRFDLANPGAAASTIGNLGFVPEGIDFRPGTADLYAVDVGGTTSQLYKIDVTSGAVTPVGTGFNSVGPVSTGPAYDLTGPQTFGFDFNPTTLQADQSMRIRLVSSGGVNLRLNSSAGTVAGIDGALSYNSSTVPGVDAAAYTNSNTATSSGVTQLFVMDYTNNSLALQSPPNIGTLTTVGGFGVSITDTISNISFDILTDQNDADTTIVGDKGYAVLRRTSAPAGGSLGAYLLYDVNLATGGISNGALVGAGVIPEDFTGGFAVSPFVPSPSAALMLGLASVAAGARRRRTA